MSKYLFSAALALAAVLGADEIVLAPKPTHMAKYIAPHKPIYRIADLRAKHAGHAEWRQVIIDDDQLHTEYISSAPGSAVSKRFHPDNRAWWVVMDGQIEFAIEGQQPFIAGKGAIVQVPKQTIFSLKTVGDKPALRYECNIAKSETLYPKDSSPTNIPSFEFTTVRLARQPGPYGAANKPIVTFDELAKTGERARTDKSIPGYRGGLYLASPLTDDRANSGFIYGYEKDLTPLKKGDRGHYHTTGAESWIILRGQIKYTIEGQEPFVAEVGDVVYVPPFLYHSPRFHGEGPACRLSMNGYPGIAHLWDVPRD